MEDSDSWEFVTLLSVWWKQLPVPRNNMHVTYINYYEINSKTQRRNCCQYISGKSFPKSSHHTSYIIFGILLFMIKT